MPPDSPLSIKVFLSHKYQAPTVNQYFFQLFSQTNVQFEVDKGKFSTNVTRLERMIRDVDGFLAIYPFDDDGQEEATDAELRERSRYFRLELDLAARSRQPGIVFRDERYLGTIDVPPTMSTESFDVREIVSHAGSPRSARFERAFSQFCERVRASSQYSVTFGNPVRDSRKVGILLPTGSPLGYGSEHIDAISNAVTAARYKPVTLGWPPSIKPDWISEIDSLNWIIADVGAESMSTGLIGFLHGAFVPTMRLMKVENASEAVAREMPGSPFYGGVEVGYWKDIARWWDTASLLAEIGKRLTTLGAPTRHFGNLAEASGYFQEAAKRKERVFISYSGADEEATKDLRAAFAKRFQEVFDYRDGKSIRPGQPWLDEIFKSLSKSPVCVTLLSSTYVDSGNCMHELRDAVAQRDAKHTRLYPIKIRKDDVFATPAPLADIQYLHLGKYPNPDALVEAIIADLDKPAGPDRAAS
jgi:TIR domain